MKKNNKGTIEGYKNLQIAFNLRKASEGSKKLAIMLPGAGYTADAPLFRYASQVFLGRSFDVLEINYRYDSETYSDLSKEEIGEAIQFDVKTIIDKVLSEGTYEDFYLVGKSLGTIAMASELQRQDFKLAKAIWLTPLLPREDVFIALAKCHHTSLLFIGDKDPYYIEDRYTQLQHNPNITFHLVPGANHSLEHADDVSESIDVLKNVVSEIEKF